MFLLLYIPIINRHLSPQAIEEMAEQLAERMLQANPDAVGSGDDVPRDRRELQRQIAEMMTNMQANYRDRNGLPEEAGQEADCPEGREEEPEDAAEIERLAPARDFLERCFKTSA
jgi:hypothetical protein